MTQDNNQKAMDSLQKRIEASHALASSILDEVVADLKWISSPDQQKTPRELRDRISDARARSKNLDQILEILSDDVQLTTRRKP